MGRFVEGSDRNQTTLFPECLDDWIDEDNPVRVIDAFVDAIDGVVPLGGRPAGLSSRGRAQALPGRRGRAAPWRINRKSRGHTAR
jgi:hypothetical protein